ncbi:MAG: RNA polymerase sigma factor (sigma-70 family) [Crocinitomix sp.]|jgi:RNA polymerase sigma factor (sigma-70 family)
MNKFDIDTKTWYADFEQVFHSYAYARVNDREIAADLVQDTFLAGLKALGKFEGKSTVKTWLFSILKRKIIDTWRMQGTRKTMPFSMYQKNAGESDAGFENNIQSTQITGEREFENKELREALFKSIYALPNKWIPIVVDRLIYEHSCEEIGEKYEISVNNVWVIIFRAKAKLREDLTVKLEMAS